jgi:hypothetical protein
MTRMPMSVRPLAWPVSLRVLALVPVKRRAFRVLLAWH